MAENQANAAADEAAEPIVGHVTRIQGSVIDVEFPVGHMPDIYNALTVEIKQMGQQEEGEVKDSVITLEVEQHLGDSTARCVALKSTDGLVRGAIVHEHRRPRSRCRSAMLPRAMCSTFPATFSTRSRARRS